MSLAQYLRIVRTRWVLLALAAAAGAVLAAAVSALQSPVYSATATLFVTTQAAGSSPIAALNQGSTFSQQRVKSYAKTITAPAVLQPVIDDLGLDDVTPKDLAEQVTASSPLDTVLIDLTVEDGSAEGARDLANRIAEQFTVYVAELEQPAANGRPPVKITITSPAIAPEGPISPRTSLNIALGLMVGLALGLGTAVVRDALDRSIGEKHDAGEVARAPVLGVIGDDPEARTAPLIVHNTFSPRAEAYRQLRTNIRFLGVDGEVRSLVVTSSVAGEGKTTTAANLAVTLAQGGDKVVLIDADLRRPTAAGLFGLSNGLGLTSVLLGDVSLDDAMQRWRSDLMLWVLPSGPVPPNPSELVGSHRMVTVVDGLLADGFVVVIDSPPLLPVTDAAILARVTNGALLVARAGSTRAEQLSDAAEALRTAAATILGVAVNALPRGTRSHHLGAEGYAYESVPATPPATDRRSARRQRPAG